MIIKSNTVVLGSGHSISPGYVEIEGQLITAIHKTLPHELLCVFNIFYLN
jgi:hypothetical protein